MNIAIPPSTGMQYRLAEMQFWNEHLPKMLLHPGKDIPLPIRPKGPRPQILDIADGIGKYANASRDYDTYGSRLVTLSSLINSRLIPSPKNSMYEIQILFASFLFFFLLNLHLLCISCRSFVALKIDTKFIFSLNFEILLWNIDGIFK